MVGLPSVFPGRLWRYVWSSLPSGRLVFAGFSRSGSSRPTVYARGLGGCVELWAAAEEEPDEALEAALRALSSLMIFAQRVMKPKQSPWRF